MVAAFSKNNTDEYPTKQLKNRDIIFDLPPDEETVRKEKRIARFKKVTVVDDDRIKARKIRFGLAMHDDEEKIMARKKRFNMLMRSNTVLKIDADIAMKNINSLTTPCNLTDEKTSDTSKKLISNQNEVCDNGNFNEKVIKSYYPLTHQIRGLIKRPPSTYSLYTKENYELCKEKNPNAQPREIVKLLSASWHSLSTKEKEKYSQKYKELRRQYDKEIMNQAYIGYKKLVSEGVQFAIDLSVNDITDFEPIWKTLSGSKKKLVMDAAKRE